MADWYLTVGLEIHVELATKTKMFCGCKNDPFNSEPNTNVCPICYGLPGTLPLINQEAVRMAVKLGHALNGQVAEQTFWARKNYFYPDLPKGYQISQSSAPVIGEAGLTIDGQSYGIERAHLEEDAGKLTHPAGSDYSLVDYNRAGVPLLEIVTKPVFTTAESAKQFAQELQRILRRLKLSNADMEKGEMRCEANISVSQTNDLGTKVEVKNINSFRAVEKAINYERERQIKLLEGGEEVEAETRTWQDADSSTRLMRRKETSADYRYFPEPDLPLVKLEVSERQEHRLPEHERQDLIALGVDSVTAKTLVDRGIAEPILALGDAAQQFAKIYLAYPKALELKPEFYQKLVAVKQARRPTKDQLVNIIDKSVETKTDPSRVATEILGDGGDLEPLVKQVLADQLQAVADYKKGKEASLHFLVGKVMAASQGKASIQQVRSLVTELLKS